MNKTGLAPVRSAALMILLCLTSCADDGDQGPQGEKGDPGENGNANVIYSDWFALETNRLKETVYVDASTTGLLYQFNAPAITQEILDRGLVLIFFTNDGKVYPLPALNYQGLGVNIELNAFELSSFYLLLQRKGVQLSLTSELVVEDAKSFRYIVIPGGNPSFGNGRVAAPVDYRNYEAVKHYYNIPD